MSLHQPPSSWTFKCYPENIAAQTLEKNVGVEKKSYGVLPGVRKLKIRLNSKFRVLRGNAS